MLSHAVYFSLKDRSPAAVQALVAACQKYLTGHPGTVSFAVGTVAPYDRQVNDRDFDVALEIVFESHAAHDAYQTAERRNQFVAEQATTWAHVRVFDVDLVTHG
ncbi:MAG: Dabb family protein [Planctomycetia bacterium]|nr:Dabb family protein [Planctomycetia bacterium]